MAMDIDRPVATAPGKRLDDESGKMDVDDWMTPPHPTRERGRPSQPGRGLTPEEESLPDADDEFDDTLPADLWFRARIGLTCGSSELRRLNL